MTLSDDNFLDKKKYSFVVYMVDSYKIYQLNVTLTSSRTGPIAYRGLSHEDMRCLLWYI